MHHMHVRPMVSVESHNSNTLLVVSAASVLGSSIVRPILIVRRRKVFCGAAVSILLSMPLSMYSQKFKSIISLKCPPLGSQHNTINVQQCSLRVLPVASPKHTTLVPWNYDYWLGGQALILSSKHWNSLSPPNILEAWHAIGEFACLRFYHIRRFACLMIS
ncbi:hypothetical protein BD410DRAFT_50609 [Rickenella mellea]|uniref:Uncharacterized protein n=1 Tax=Rickenella mellea TaxID=50990 RepID=A0A4R5XFY1_9AGAM|nr:hypothetical protein BD410DRAFT_50609 [Rickenella mellea]